ncbi:hypothetical protein RRG08_055749 [Elysia crispata]|uniref:Uncharacterized protein n=1 Tax=Elysia crispata TaxID=231223 RepID=A0AAE1AAB7_9GAST|nr:hypothetical protein RRG08_055749 [Elysia crispata]
MPSLGLSSFILNMASSKTEVFVAEVTSASPSRGCGISREYLTRADSAHGNIAISRAVSSLLERERLGCLILSEKSVAHSHEHPAAEWFISYV